ncbi:MAG: Ku protein [Firmicutes bacterium]|nr:Ku protein [Bacillota bacterium]
MANVHSNISFALVNIPVIMKPIIRNNDTSFNQLHDKCHHRIKYVKYCPYCKKDVKEKDVIKGYEYEKDNYLIFEKTELNKLKLINDKEIDVVAFVALNEIDPYYFEKSYFLETENKSKAYNLFCEALKKTKKVALAKTIIGSKFYYCILRFIKSGIIMTTLYFEEEVYLPSKDLNAKANETELNLAIKLIESLSGKFEPEKYKDEYQEKIKEAINDKLEGKEIKGKKKSPKKQVSDLMEALEKSLRKK